jgi:hypothetical protein
MEGVTQVLWNMPKEFQRWNKYYKQKDRSIQPEYKQKGKTITPSEKKEGSWTRPFDVSMPINETIRAALETGEDHHLVTLGNSWDPLYAAMGFHKGKFDIKVKDFSKEPCELYKNGSPTDSSKKAAEDDDDGSAETVEKTAKKTPKKRKDDTGTKNKQMTGITVEDVKEIICSTVKKQKLGRAATNEKHMKMWNELAKGFIGKITGTEPPIDEKIIEDTDMLSK